MPAPPPPFGPAQPDDPNAQALDPALSILGQFFRAMLEFYAGEAWANIAPGEPVVRKLSVGFDPEHLDFQDGDTPLLALWRDKDGAPTRFDDGNVQSATTIHVLWVAAPADEQKLAARSPFFVAFQNVMKLAFQNERDPCFIARGEESNVISRTYGSYVWGLAGIDGWHYTSTERVPVMVPTGGQREDFPAYLSTWTILESTSTDPAAFGSTINSVRVGTERTSFRFDLTDGVAGDDVLIRQSALVPPDDP